jgi:hypothetical protein
MMRRLAAQKMVSLGVENKLLTYATITVYVYSAKTEHAVPYARFYPNETQRHKDLLKHLFIYLNTA